MGVSAAEMGFTWVYGTRMFVRRGGKRGGCGYNVSSARPFLRVGTSMCLDTSREDVR